MRRPPQGRVHAKQDRVEILRSLSPAARLENDPTHLVPMRASTRYFGLNGAGLAKRAASIAAFGRTSASSIMFCPLVHVTRM